MAGQTSQSVEVELLITEREVMGSTILEPELTKMFWLTNGQTFPYKANNDDHKRL